MAGRTHTWNAYESSLTGPLVSGATSVAVDSALGLVAPIYLVLDPDVPDKREWIRVNTINGNVLENLVRDQAGSVGDIDHLAGAKIRTIMTKQNLDDIWDDIEAGELALTQHITDGGDPHAQAGYLKRADTDALYVELSGDIMSGFLTLFADPTTGLHAATKQYVDSEIDTDIATHTAIVDAHHEKYTDAEAIAAVGPHTTLHADLTDVAEDDHHVKYTDAEAIAAGDGNFLPLTGGVVAGRLQVEGGNAANPGYGFDGDTGTGMHWAGSGAVGFSSNGTDVALFQPSAVYLPKIYSSSSGLTPNVAVDSQGRMWRGTSARKDKSNIASAAHLADLTLEPVTFDHNAGGSFIGFIADDMPIEEAIVRDLDGAVENYDVRAVVAILAAKVARLESA